MSAIAHTLARLLLLAALALAATQPAAGAHGPRPAAQPCRQDTPRIGTITGTVRGGDGQPLQGVTVTAYTTTGAALPAGVSDAAGAYGNAQLPSGTYLLEFRPPPGPHQVIWYPKATAPLAATPVEVKGSGTTGGIDVTLPAGAQLNVALRDPQGGPVSQGQVPMFDRHGRPVAGGWTDDGGRALTAPGLPPGSYRLLARPPYDSPLLAQYHSRRPTLAAADPITVTQAGSVDLPMAMQLGAQLGGIVTDAASGAPLAGVSVAIRGAGGATAATWDHVYAFTDAQGRYSVAGLPSGTYRVEFSPARAEPGAHAPQSRLVTLSAPGARAGFDAALARGGTLSGRVIAPDGSPIADARVSASDGGAIDAYSYSAADGTFAIYGLPSGRYTLEFARDGHQRRAPAEEVTVTAPDTTALAAAVLSPGGAIAGRVTGPDGRPVAGVTVRVLDGATGARVIAEAPTNADGAYTTAATLASGSYIVRFDPPSGDGACHLAFAYAGGAATASDAARVQVSAPDTLGGVDAALEYGGLITGQIRDAASGQPLNATVQVYDAGGTPVMTGGSSYLGHYRTAAALPPGAYRVQVRAAGYVPMFYGGATALEAAAPVPAGASDVSIALTPGGTLAGRVTAADTGAPLERAAVTLYGAGGRAIDARLTAFDGSYRFEGELPSGAYRIGVAPGRREDGRPYFTGYAPVFSGGAGSLAQAQPVGVVAPGAVEVNLAMPSTTPPAPPPPAATHAVYLPLAVR